MSLPVVLSRLMAYALRTRHFKPLNITGKTQNRRPPRAGASQTLHVLVDSASSYLNTPAQTDFAQA